MSKQTAVEWLVSEYAKAFKISVNAVMGETIEQAKAMEKEQHCTTYINAMKECMINPLGDELYLEDAKQYYNETYGGDK